MLAAQSINDFICRYLPIGQTKIFNTEGDLMQTDARTAGALRTGMWGAAQTAPFFGGFFLVGGYVVMIAALYQLAEEQQKTNALVAVVFTSIFATLIFFNYISQTTFIPAMAQAYQPAYDAAISIFSLANPLSLCWAIEMWGYALLGVAT